jgi:ABC-type transport system substrate-binding protein
MYGPSIGQGNLARAKLPGFDEIYRRMLLMPDGPERAALFLQASNIVTAYMPYRAHVHRLYNDLNHPWIVGYRQPLFHNDGWHYVEVDAELRDRLLR